MQANHRRTNRAGGTPIADVALSVNDTEVAAATSDTDIPVGCANDPYAEALARLKNRLLLLHRTAGQASSRKLLGLIEPGRTTHTTINKTLRCERRPSWHHLECLVKAMGGDVEEFRQLWIAVGTAADLQSR